MIKHANSFNRDNQDIDKIIVALDLFAYGDIHIILQGKTVLAPFILCCCLLEQIATYRYGTNKRLGKFVKAYMPNYDGDVLQFIRNKLMHNYSFHEKYAVGRDCSEMHLKKDEDGCIVIDVGMFAKQIKRALDVFKSELHSVKEVRNNALKVVREHNILSMSAMRVLVDDNGTSHGVIIFTKNDSVVGDK